MSTILMTVIVGFTRIVGGAVVPVIIGRLGDHYGLRAGMAVLYLAFGCVLSVGFWAKPIISLATRPYGPPKKGF